VPSEDSSIRWLRISCAIGILDLYGGFHKPGRPQVAIPQGHGDLCDVPAEQVFPLGRMDFRCVCVGGGWRGCAGPGWWGDLSVGPVV
jgi:hypothetical protein